MRSCAPIYAAVGAGCIFLSILASSLGTQRAAAALPRPTETFKFSEIAREVRQIFQSLKNRNFAALFFYGLAVGVASGLGMALYLYNTTYFFGFSGAQIATTGVGVLVSPAIAYWAAPYLGARFGKKQAAIGAMAEEGVPGPSSSLAPSAGSNASTSSTGVPSGRQRPPTSSSVTPFP